MDMRDSSQTKLSKTKYIKGVNHKGRQSTKPETHPPKPLQPNSVIHPLLGGTVFGDSLGTLRDSVLGKFTTGYINQHGIRIERKGLTNGRISRTEVWISRDEMVDRWLYEASLEASDAILSKMSETNEFRIAMALLLLPFISERPKDMKSGEDNSRDTSVWVNLFEDLVDV